MSHCKLTYSIVIPALNEEAALPQCLASVTGQAFDGAFEMVVVDNGSTDRTAEVARLCGARVVPCMRRGVVYARQAGLKAALGEVVVHLDADSQLRPGTLRLLAARFADPRVVVAAGDVHYVPGTVPTHAMQLAYRFTNRTLKLVLGRPLFALAGALAMRRSALLSAGGYELGLPHTGDESGILARLSRQGKVVWEPRFVVDSSDRRFRGRFVRWFFSDLFVHTFLDQLRYRVTRRSNWGERRAIR